jgi:endonuclease YncB( thermonuclease family)
VFTHVDAPNEVFDTYGRLVGDIEVTVGGHKVDVNHWLVEQGFAYPTFYSSMNADEIKAFLALAKTARTKKRRSGRASPRPFPPSTSTCASPSRARPPCSRPTRAR